MIHYETLRIMREKIKDVPANLINLDFFRSTADNSERKASMAPYYDPDNCGTHGCVIGWGALTPELAPLPTEFICETGDITALQWNPYIQRILGLRARDRGWNDIPIYRWLFLKSTYPTKVTPDQIKDEIIRRLEVAEVAIREHPEDLTKAYHFTLEA